jgi:hypothetical protein
LAKDYVPATVPRSPRGIGVVVPIAFISYSWDSQDHKLWVKKLATDLMAKGVTVLLDVWEVRFGGDLGDFMEKGIPKADRVLMICTDTYLAKVNNGNGGGVAYEKTMVRAELIETMDSAKFVPIIRDQAGQPAIPNFMPGRMYVDLRDDAHYDAILEELARDIHGLSSRPPLGDNPFQGEGIGAALVR